MSAAGPARIHQLSEALSNQIAAGEVIERPAAVLKELAENSLDAHATSIRILSEDGGRRLLQVEDDGTGIAGEDLSLAFARHATSKLSTSEDLFRIRTLGFRGEALPSIAAVSECTLVSRPPGSAAGRRLSLAGAELRADEPCAMAFGTVVAVRNLFWNVPARLKFLKSEASETGHLTEQVNRLALAHPEVGFLLKADARTVIEVPARQLLPARVRALFGPGFADSLIAVAEHAVGMQVAGFVAHPREAKSTSRRQYTFLNGRWVRDKLLLAAVREGFKGFLEPRLHGAVILHLDCDPELVDVNVHPTKSEVRFRREGEVFSLLARAVATALRANSGEFSLLTPQDAARAASDASATAGITGSGDASILSRLRVRESAPSVIQERFLPHQPQITADANLAVTGPGGPPAGEAIPTRVAWDRPSSASATISSTASSTASSSAAPAGAVGPSASAGIHLPSCVRRVLQLNRMFLLIETDSGIRLVDQHALHEKMLFVALEPGIGEFQAGGSQQLLVPRTIDLSAAEVAALEPLLPQLQEVGIQAEGLRTLDRAGALQPAAAASAQLGRLLRPAGRGRRRRCGGRHGARAHPPQRRLPWRGQGRAGARPRGAARAGGGALPHRGHGPLPAWPSDHPRPALGRAGASLPALSAPRT